MSKLIFYISFCLLAVHSLVSGQDSRSLFDGKSLNGWEITPIEGHGKVKVSDNSIILNRGNRITGIDLAGEFPLSNYEVTLEAQRIEGSDFFCAMTFPVKGSYCTLVIGGWGGSLVGLSSIDGADAANNLTGQVRGFNSGVWYHVKLRVTDEKIEAWIDNENVVDFTIGTYSLSLRWEMEQSIPFGIATYNTTGAVRNIKVTSISPL